jgi:hypothetical protein
VAFAGEQPLEGDGNPGVIFNEQDSVLHDLSHVAGRC